MITLTTTQYFGIFIAMFVAMLSIPYIINYYYFIFAQTDSWLESALACAILGTGFVVVVMILLEKVG